MQKLVVKLLAAMIAVFAVSATPAYAQASRTWVSGVGDDANPCSRTAPCKTFAGAISKTAALGEINCLDPGGFGAVTITKSITLNCTGTLGSVLSTGITINAASTDRVVIDGLDIEGTGTGTNGINIVQARDVLVRNTIIRGFAGAPGNGILVNGTAKIALTVENSTIFSSVNGIRVQSSGGNGVARVYDSLIAVASGAGISVTGTGNVAEISGNQITRASKSLEILSGGAIISYGDNVLSPGDAPTLTPKG